SDSIYGFSNSSYTLQAFKDEVEMALKEEFGRDVERKNKSIKIYGNTYRVDVDAVACMRHRDYTNDYAYDTNNYLGVIFIQSAEGQTIINYPEQHIRNGRDKNNRTKLYYKKMVRIIKKMRYIMQDEYIESANNVSSFGLESLLWNLPDEVFTKYAIYRYAFGEITEYLIKNTDKLANYKEANGIKPLCNSSTERENYIKFIKDLYYFYEYEVPSRILCNVKWGRVSLKWI